MPTATSNTALILRKRFGAKLKEFREDADLTQAELAEILNYRYPATVSQIERGAAAMPPAELARWAEATRIPPKKLVDLYLYYVEPFLFAALHGRDPYAAEQLPTPDPTIARRTPRKSVGAS